MSPPLPRLSHASLTRLLAAAQRSSNAKRISPEELQRYVTQWFPRELWSSSYGASNCDRGTPSNARTANPFQQFCRDPPLVSSEWAAALQLVALARYVEGSAKCTAAGSSARRSGASASPVTPTIQTLEHLLRFGVFPPAGWSVTLALLHAWRHEQRKQLATSSPSSLSDERRSAHAALMASPLEQPSPLLFPTALPAPATAQLLYHISLAPPSTERWQDALRLYQASAAQTYTQIKDPYTGRPHAAPSVTAADAAPATSAFLKALRHTTLTTLLQAGEWERGLHFYYHSLYQRDLPGTVTTGYLVQALGRAGQWAAVLQVYELCVKLLHARRQMRRERHPTSDEPPSRTWGTTLSMAMAAVQCCPAAPPAALWAMLRQLEGEGGCDDSSPSPPPLLQLDGNFLSAVQALAQEDDRIAVLRYAKRGGLLDAFKLMRGLLSKHQWEEALMVFAEAMKATVALPSTGPSGMESTPATARGGEDSRSAVYLSRREIGETRLSFLHSSTIHNVRTVVAFLNAHRSGKGGAGEGRGHCAVTTDAWALNDQEVECVLSKTLEANESAAAAAAPGRVADFWQYCLQLLDHNYGALQAGPPPHTDMDSTGAGVAAVPLRPTLHIPSTSSSPRRRRPTASALSFLLRHPRLPWQVALQLIEAYDLLDASHDSEAAHKKDRRGRSATQNGGGRDRGPTDINVTPRTLALSAAVERLSSQGQRKAAEELALRALAVEVAAPKHARGGVPLSAGLLQLVSLPTLRALLLGRRHDGLYVEKRVLFHLLRESVSAGAKRSRNVSRKDGDADLAEVDRDERFFDDPCGRALTVVHLLMQRAALTGGRSSSAANAAAALQRLPTSLFLLEAESSGDTVAPHTSPGTSPPAAWLLAYPPAVHCEVVRVIRCVTASPPSTPPSRWCSLENSAGEEARRRDGQRWTWTMRYLRKLAGSFAGHPRHASGLPRDAQPHFFSSTGGWSEMARAREAYYVATFEAVVSLLETAAEAEVSPSTDGTLLLPCGEAAPSTAGGAKGHGVGSERGEVPRRPRQRVQALCQLLERAISRYGCVPPTHMLLPNQLDRLLPPLVKPTVLSTAKGEPLRSPWEGTGGHAGVNAQERCAVAAFLVQLLLRSLSSASADVHSEAGACGQLRAVEPALLHNTLKLCCRVAEYRKELSGTLLHTAADATVDGAALCEAGGALVRLQCERCGLPTVRPGTLSLLYHLCAAVEACSPHTRPSLPKRIALETTEYLLCQQVSFANASSRSVPRRGPIGHPPVASPADEHVPRHGSRSAAMGDEQRQGGGDGGRVSVAAVLPHHGALFFSLFGWEGTLHVWYPAFPRDVLRQLSSDPRAIEACLSLAERSRE
ncbi:hypothetical protein ABB37_09163 [Leptomonas pyrrhocoris]|uniref:Uncharacterized protein n=1 Tax=Leptomonas pyrrhocoris TaxID=157538 RepID=A0A0M9FRD4_LEPPY|nr:hypothetical protein ABB37_09163 [Leptomonas pyrrhocoris]KPA74500.1 hypothetical protein ABB37_09163 [Leptomonas pyrrhocoris]|eukprot:XP_015652939.1 hypothetical protein ABB37_09163 [Leptomonas pyrrhocoris]